MGQNRGMRDKNLALLTSSSVVKRPFDFPAFEDTELQLMQRVPKSVSMVNAVGIYCYRCNGGHMIKDCKIVKCKRCAGLHYPLRCPVPAKDLKYSKCSLTTQNTDAHP